MKSLYLRLTFIVFFVLSFSYNSILFSQESKINKLIIQLENSDEDTSRINILNNLASQYLYVDLEKSKNYTDLALNLSKNLKDKHGLAFSYSNLGIYYTRTNEFDSSLFFLKKSLEKFEELNDIYGQIHSLHLISIIYSSKTDNLKAIEYLYKCLELSEDKQYPELMSDIYNALSTNYNSVNNFTKAFEFIKKSHEFDLLLKDSIKISRSLTNMAYYYLKADSIEKAKDYYQKSFLLNKKINNKSTLAYCYYGLAIVNDKIEMFDTAYSYFNNAIKLFNEFENSQMVGLCHSRLGNHFYLLGQLDSAIYYAKLGIETSKKYDDPENLRNTYNLIHEIYALKKDFKNAYKYAYLHKQMQDSLQKAEISQNLTISELEYNFKLVQQEISLRQKTVKNYIIAAFITVFVFVLLIIYILFLKIRKNKILKSANNTRDKMMRLIAHDFRSPLISIGNTVQTIPFLIDNQDSNGAKNMCENVEGSVSRVLSLIDNLINWTLSQNETIPYAPDNYNLKDICTDIIEIYRSIAEFKQIKILNHIAPDNYIYADKNILITILRNLINNAIKFTPEKGEIILTAEQQNNKIQISVQDNGIGIEKDKLKTIFNIEQKNNLGTKGEKGNGLGLFFCKEFALQNQGDIWVESEIGKGSTFYFTVPKS